MSNSQDPNNPTFSDQQWIESIFLNRQVDGAVAEEWNPLEAIYIKILIYFIYVFVIKTFKIFHAVIISFLYHPCRTRYTHRAVDKSFLQKECIENKD